jgi:acyl dehydratase
VTGEELRARAIRRTKGRSFNDFELGQVFNHHWGRTLNEGDNSLFTTLTLSYNPLYFNADYARAFGHRNVQVNPMLVFLTVFGLSVEDLSEGGGLFLGVDELTFHEPVYPGETVFARSTVVDKRKSETRPDNGIVAWHTQGFKLAAASGAQQAEIIVIDFKRSNFSPIRPARAGNQAAQKARRDQ